MPWSSVLARVTELGNRRPQCYYLGSFTLGPTFTAFDLWSFILWPGEVYILSRYLSLSVSLCHKVIGYAVRVRANSRQL